MEGETEEERFERAQQEAGIKKAEFQGEEETRKSLNWHDELFFNWPCINAYSQEGSIKACRIS